jgi:hypothetical protein
MAHRDFTDSAGTEWFVFDVTPRADERRSYDRRRNEAETGKVDEVEDRRGDSRRITVGQRPPRLTQGWLCFEREGERRRLQPVPENWTTLPDSELEKLLQAARVAPFRKRVDSRAAPKRR